MADTVLLVDLENVGKIGLKTIPDAFRVLVFFGSADKKVSMELFDAALELKDRFDRIKMEGQGKNALDFHIAYYLGEKFQKDPNANCIVVSKDKGFDPLIKHLTGRSFNVCRVATVEEATKQPKVKAKQAKPVTKEPKAKPKPAASKPSPPADPFVEVVSWLKSTDKKRRPQKRKKLVVHIFNHLGKKIKEATVEAFVDKLIAENKISETNGSLAYHF